MEEGIPSQPPRPMPLPRSPLAPRPDEDAALPSTAIVPIAPSHKSTYVVQAPKDQIFRVPPPENALIVEEYRNRAKNSPSSRPCCLRFASLFAALIAVALLCLCGVIIFYFVANPSVPHISVDRIAVANPSSAKPSFDVGMKARNPSKAMDFFYKDGGKVEMFHQGKRIAAGDSHEFNIGHEDTTEIKLSLQGTKATLPKEIKATSKGSKDVFPLSLSASFPVRLGLGAFRTRSKDLGVDCDLKVRKVGKKLYVKSQNCRASFS